MSPPLTPTEATTPPNPQQESQALPRVPQDLSIHLARTEAWMHDALDSAKMLGWEFDIAANRWSTTTDVPNFFGAPRGPDYTEPAPSATVIHPDDFEYVVAKRREAIETGEPMRYEFRGNFPAPDGSVRWFTTRGRALRDATGKPVRLLGVTADVSERKRAEQARAALDQQLLDAQKWESLGVLAGGVAHDFNNILTIILGSAGLARRGLPQGSTAAPHLEQIEQASRRAADLCRQLLAYTGRGPVSASSADPNELIRSSAALFGVQVSESAKVRYDLADNLPAIRADPAQARQVLINLAMNAAEAVGENEGEIRITTEAVEIAVESNVGYHLPPAPGKYVRLLVSDTGPGISPEVKAQMFDPFFTTKFAGRGLGLSAVLGIMRLHGGAIRVTSVPGNTTVEVLWPVNTDMPASTTGSRAIAQPPLRVAPKPGSHGKVLVIDDEMYVRELAASALQELGYEVLLAGDGSTALGLFQKHRSEVRFAVLDVMMPGMTGDQVLEALRVLQRNLPAVIISGFTDRRTINTGSGTRTEFLQKPFHPEELIAVVERLMKTQK
ncbi:MAG: response regulator [Planctomycetes bacterium]|nr:response regulator [Planctomycetota bacterium]